MPEIPANRRFAPFPHTSGLSDYEAAEARQAFGQSIAVAIRAYGRKPMFTIKPANDTEEFYAAIKIIADAPKIKSLWEEMNDAYSGSN